MVKKYRKKTVKGKGKLVTKAEVSKMINENIELKNFAYQHTEVVPVSTTNGSFHYINWNRGPAQATGAGNVDTTPFVQGAQSNQRVGSEILIHSIELRFSISMNAAATDNPHVRFMVFQEKWPENTTFVASDMFVDVGSGNTVYSPIKTGEKKQFVIYHDQLISLGQQDGPVGVAPLLVSKAIVYKKRFKKPIKALYYDNAAAPVTGSLAATGIEKCGMIFNVIADIANVAFQTIYSNMTYTDA